jgi:hypothetical protein
MPVQLLAIDMDCDAPGIVPGKKLIETRIEQGLKMTAQSTFQETGGREGGIRYCEFSGDRGGAFNDQTGGWNPFPRRAMPRSHVPGGCDVAFPSAGLGKNFAANEQAEFYSDSGKSNSLATDFVLAAIS